MSTFIPRLHNIHISTYLITAAAAAVAEEMVILGEEHDKWSVTLFLNICKQWQSWCLNQVFELKINIKYIKSFPGTGYNYSQSPDSSGILGSNI